MSYVGSVDSVSHLRRVQSAAWLLVPVLLLIVIPAAAVVFRDGPNVAPVWWSVSAILLAWIFFFATSMLRRLNDKYREFWLFGALLIPLCEALAYCTAVYLLAKASASHAHPFALMALLIVAPLPGYVLFLRRLMIERRRSRAIEDERRADNLVDDADQRSPVYR